MSDSPSPRSAIGARTSVILVAGVSGSGKSTVGAALAERLGWSYAEADAFHPDSNVAKMSAGIPLTDEDRAPWLATIARYVADVCERGDHAVVSCSALKHTYRSTLVGTHGDRVRIVLLDGTEEEIAARLGARKGHFMPPELLRSQFATLERPTPDEHVVLAPIAGTPEEIVDGVVRALAA